MKLDESRLDGDPCPQEGDRLDMLTALVLSACQIAPGVVQPGLQTSRLAQSLGRLQRGMGGEQGRCRTDIAHRHCSALARRHAATSTPHRRSGLAQEARSRD